MGDQSNLFNRIIVPVDGSNYSKKATKKVLTLSKFLNTDVLAIHVVDVTPLTRALPPDKTYEVWEKAIEEKAEKVMDDTKKLAEEMEIDIETMMVKGDPADEIIKEGKENDLVIMGAKGHSAFESIFVGSVSEKVLHHSRANVMIIR